MEALGEAQVRSAIRNCSKGERLGMHVPRLTDVAWDELEYFGWRDPKAPLRGYLVQATPDGPRGIALRAPESRVRKAAQCALCHVVHKDGVSLFVAQRAGAAGRNGNTVGVYVCDDLACSRHLREKLKPSRQLPDPRPVLAAQGAELVRRLDAFVDQVLATA